MKKTVAIMLLLTTFAASAQEKYNTKFFIRSAVGYTWGLNSMFKDAPTDVFINYADDAFYLNLVSTDLFFGKKRNWGIGFTFMGNLSSKPNDERFTRQFEASYHDYDTETIIGTTETNSTSVFYGALGITYRFEKNRIVVMPRCLFGITGFETYYNSINMKKKNSNLYYQLRYSPDGKVHDFFTINPSLTLGYRINRFLLLSVDLMYTYYKVDFSYQETFTNFYTGEELANTYRYNDPISNISVGVGVCMAFGREKN